MVNGKVRVTDPDASTATNARNRRLEPAYKQRTVVDDLRGIVVDVEERWNRAVGP